MYSLTKTIGLSAIALCLSVPALAQDPSVSMPDYTSGMASAVCDGFSVRQQVGAPTGAPVIESGDALLFQGLFAALTETPASGTSGIGDITPDGTGTQGISYDATLKSLSVSLTDFKEGYRLLIAATDGRSILSTPLMQDQETIDLSTLTPGTYIAGIVANNKITGTLKFIVK